MGATSVSEQTTKEQLEDNISDVQIKAEDAIDPAKLAAIKAKQEAKQNQMKMEEEKKMSAKIISKKEKSLRLGIIGSGQCGSRLAECFYQIGGYDAVCLNTANVDLRPISLPDSNKLLLEHGVGGAAKSLEIGHAAADAYRGEILQLVNEKLGDSQVNILCLSLGGGSGSGSAEVLVDLLSGLGKPLVLICVLPADSDDAVSKQNSLETLSKLTKLTQAKKINNLIIVDNSKLEMIHSGVGQFSFFEVANKAIVEPIDLFNTLSSMPSSVKGIDQAEWAKLFIDGEGLSVFGELVVENPLEETGIAESIMGSLSGNLLASGFDLKQAKYVGVIISTTKEKWASIPTSSVNYAMSIINDVCGSPQGVFRGIYAIESNDPKVRVYSFFSGLALPQSRIDGLKKEVEQLTTTTKNKEEQRNLNLNLEPTANSVVSQAQAVKNKIAAKSSAFGKLMGGVQDRRNK